MNHQKFDTVVVGTGTSAYYAADTLNEAGQKVAILDERPYGGPALCAAASLKSVW